MWVAIFRPRVGLLVGPEQPPVARFHELPEQLRGDEHPVLHPHVVAGQDEVAAQFHQLQAGDQVPVRHQVGEGVGVVLVQQHVGQELVHAAQVPGALEGRTQHPADDGVGLAPARHQVRHAGVLGGLAGIRRPVGGQQRVLAGQGVAHHLGVAALPSREVHAPPQDAPGVHVLRLLGHVERGHLPHDLHQQVVSQRRAQLEGILDAALALQGGFHLRGDPQVQWAAVRLLVGQGGGQALLGGHI